METAEDGLVRLGVQWARAGAKGTNGGTAVDAVDTGALPNRGGVHVAEGERVDIPGGCIGNCDGQHPGVGDHPPSTTRLARKEARACR